MPRPTLTRAIKKNSQTTNREESENTQIPEARSENNTALQRVLRNPHTLRQPETVLQLQQTVGNKAVQRLITQYRNETAIQRNHSSSPANSELRRVVPSPRPVQLSYRTPPPIPTQSTPAPVPTHRTPPPLPPRPAHIPHRTPPPLPTHTPLPLLSVRQRAAAVSATPNITPTQPVLTPPPLLSIRQRMDAVSTPNTTTTPPVPRQQLPLSQTPSPATIEEFTSAKIEVADFLNGSYKAELAAGFPEIATKSALDGIIKPYMVISLTSFMLEKVRGSKKQTIKNNRTAMNNAISTVATRISNEKAAELQQSIPGASASATDRNLYNYQRSQLSVERVEATNKQIQDAIKNMVEESAVESILKEDFDSIFVEQINEAGDIINTEAEKATTTGLEALDAKFAQQKADLLSRGRNATQNSSTSPSTLVSLAAELRDFGTSYKNQTDNIMGDVRKTAFDKAGAIQKSVTDKAKTNLGSRSNKGLRDQVKARMAERARQLIETDTTTEATTPEQRERQELKKQIIADAKSMVFENQESSMQSTLAKVGKAIDSLVTEDGDKTSMEFKVKIPVGGGIAYVSIHLVGEFERDDGKTKTKFQLSIGGGGDAGISELEGELGGYLEAQAATGPKAMSLISYALYRRCRESSVIPRELTNALWGLGGRSKRENESESTAKYREAEDWGAAMESEMGDEDYAETGAHIGGEASVDFGPASLNVKADARTGRRYTKKLIEQAHNNNRGWFTRSAPTGRGAQTIIGADLHGFDIEIEGGVEGIGGGKGVVSVAYWSHLDRFRQNPEGNGTKFAKLEIKLGGTMDGAGAEGRGLAGMSGKIGVALTGIIQALEKAKTQVNKIRTANSNANVQEQANQTQFVEEINHLQARFSSDREAATDQLTEALTRYSNGVRHTVQQNRNANSYSTRATQLYQAGNGLYNTSSSAYNMQDAIRHQAPSGPGLLSQLSRGLLESSAKIELLAGFKAERENPFEEVKKELTLELRKQSSLGIDAAVIETKYESSNRIFQLKKEL